MKQSLRLFAFTGALLLLQACQSKSGLKKDQDTQALSDSTHISTARENINRMLDSFNIAAANADFAAYFNYFSEDAVFIGTDATEHWSKGKFMVWAKPYFDRGETWHFKSLDRNIYFHTSGDLAWFDELLNTQMKICRGSGVLVRKETGWKIQQYVLSVTVPNSVIDSIVSIKGVLEDQIIASFQSN